MQYVLLIYQGLCSVHQVLVNKTTEKRGPRAPSASTHADHPLAPSLRQLPCSSSTAPAPGGLPRLELSA